FQTSPSLLAEEICVATCPGQLQLVIHDAIQQQPIWLDMGISVTLPVSLQCMILVGIRQGRLLKQQAQQSA
ncbi:hypothetical protein TW86_20525, partial [Halomonas sp. S2151]